MVDADEHETIRRPPMVPADRPPAAGAGAEGAVREPDDADTLIRAPLRPPVSAGDGSEAADEDADENEDEDDGGQADAPHPAAALRFRISNGAAQLVLDEDVHIGRNPRPPRLDRGRPVRLLRVESPTGVVSSSHLGLRRLGSTAVAADLMSTNGTVVFLPGSPPRRLRQGESVVAPPGTRLEIGEGIVIEVIKPGALD